VLLNEPDAGWFAIWVATAGPQVDVDAEWRLLQRVKSPSGYVTVSIAGRPVSVGRAVADTGCAGIFNMATLPEARGQGAARAVLTALTNWATDQDTHRLYLQVEHDNAAALAVYRRAGFHHLCTYHYRTAALQLSDSPNAL
jgi:ribosomal protein S18 acetylase RimI-like enzyme